MKNMKKILALALVIVSVLAIAIPAMALQGSYKPYLGGDGTSDNLRRYQTSTAVRNLQIMLNNVLGTNLDTDGIFGQQTEIAVKNFQMSYLGNWAVDGIVGPMTKNALWYNCSSMTGLQVAFPEYLE